MGIKDIVAGRVDWKLRVRILNLWNVPVKNSPQETQSMEMVFLDAKKDKIGATVPKCWIPIFEDHLKEGATYLIENIMVTQNDIKYKKTTHKYKLTFLRTTKVTNIPDDDIPLHHFDFSDFSVILAEPRSDVIVDVIGHVVEKDTLKEKEKDGRRTILLDLVLQDATNNKVNCTMWGPYAQRMQAYLDNESTKSTNEPVIVIIQLGRLTNYLGNNGVSTGFYGTKLFINENIPATNEYKSSLIGQQNRAAQPVAQMVATNILSVTDDIMKTPKMTISDLIECTQECFAAILVTVVELNMEKGWSYNSCNKCLRVVAKVDTKFYCGHCQSNVTASPRFKLHLQVIDSTGSTTFTLFNSLVASYVGRTADQLIRANEPANNDGHIPEEFNCFFGKEFLFKVHVADINIKKGWQTYTAKKFTDDSAVIKDFVHKNIKYNPNEDSQADIEDELALVNGKHTMMIPDIKKTIKQEPVTMFEAFVTPPYKSGGKRVVPAIEGLDLNNMDFSPEAIPITDRTFTSSQQEGVKSVLNVNDLDDIVVLSDDDTPNKQRLVADVNDITPPTKTAGKRDVASIEPTDLTNMEVSPESLQKIPKNSQDEEIKE